MHQIINLVYIITYNIKQNDRERKPPGGGNTTGTKGAPYSQKFIFIFLFFVLQGQNSPIFGNISDCNLLTISILVTFSLALLM